MSDEELFGDLPVQTVSRTFEPGRPRLREPVRDRIELRAVDLDRLIGADHPARVIWDYVRGLDLQALEQAVRAREHTPGQESARDCCWRCGYMQPAKELAAHGRWPGCAKAMTPIVGSAAV
jgi:hypothetical protein